MTSDKWTIHTVGQARKARKVLSKSAKEAYAFLLLELELLGLYRSTWPNYTKMHGKDDYHCHIEKGRPTYVVCWRVINKRERILEVYYAGTHEKAPY